MHTLTMHRDADENRLSQLARSFRAIGLDPTFIETVERLNGQSNELPYHGFQHLLMVSRRAVEGALQAGLDRNIVQELAVAGLLHDLAYSPKSSERENIGQALALTKRMALPVRTEAVLRLIEASTFPHRAPRNEAEKFLQDADLMQSFEPDGERFLEALGREWGDPSRVRRDFPGEEAFNTSWGRELYRQQQEKFGRITA